MTHLTLGMLLHYLGKLKIKIFCRYSAHMKENANKLQFKCTDFNSSMHIIVYAECIYVLTEYLKHVSIRRYTYFLAKFVWLWKQPVGYSECLKWRPFALTQARSRSPHSSMASSMSLWNVQPSLKEALLEVSCVTITIGELIPAWDLRHGSQPGSSLGCVAATGQVQWTLDSPAVVAGLTILSTKISETVDE